MPVISRNVVAERAMPPWKPEPGFGPELKHSRALSPEDRAVFAAWAEAGAPRGDEKDMPPPATFAGDGRSARQTWCSKWPRNSRFRPGARIRIAAL